MSQGIMIYAGGLETSYYTIDGTSVSAQEAGVEKYSDYPIPFVPPYVLDKDQRRRNIDAMEQRAPRFLFRAWNGRSGGDRRLNTEQAVTSHADLHGKAPAAIEEVPQEILTALTTGHYAGWHVESPFSCWTGSLDYAYRLSCCLNAGDDGHLAVVDTSLLPARNRVLYADKMYQVAPQVMLNRADDYLITGTVEGQAYAAHANFGLFPHPGAPRYRAGFVDDQTPEGPRYIDRAENAESKTLEEQLDVALHIGSHYGPHFQVPFAISLLAFLNPKRDAHETMQMVRGLIAKRPGWAEQWRTDPKIMKGEFARTGSGSFPETDVAIGIMRAMAKEEYGSGFAADEVFKSEDTKGTDQKRSDVEGTQFGSVAGGTYDDKTSGNPQRNMSSPPEPAKHNASDSVVKLEEPHDTGATEQSHAMVDWTTDGVTYKEAIPLFLAQRRAAPRKASKPPNYMRREVRNLRMNLKGQEARNQELDSMTPAAPAARRDVEMADANPTAAAAPKSVKTETDVVKEDEAHVAPKDPDIKMEGFMEDD